MIERITVVKFRMDSEGGNGDGCFEVKILSRYNLDKTIDKSTWYVVVVRGTCHVVRGTWY